MVAQPTEWPAECAGTLGQSASGSGSPGYSNQEIFSQHGANLVPQPVPYDLFQITAPVNRQNRKPGDPCHTLARDNAMYTLTKADTHAVAFTPGNLARGAGASPNAEVFPTLKCSEGRGADDQRPCVAFQQNQLGEVRCNTVAGTVNTNSNASGRNTPMVAIGNDVHAVAFPINTMTIGGRPDPRNDARMTMGVGDNDDAQFTLSKAHSHALAHAFYSTGGTHGVNQHPEVSPAVKVGSGLGIPSPPAVAFTVGNAARGQGPGPNTEVFPTLKSGGGRGTDDQWPSVMTAMTVRRLTPVECERLQGFPDNWTAIPWRGKTADQCPDGPRYKALGNSMACNCMAWIGERIAEWEAR